MQLPKKVSDLPSQGLSEILKKADPTKALDTLKELYKVKYDYEVTVEQEITKRDAIKAREHEITEQIRASKEIFLGYLNKSFDERRGNFEKLFNVLEREMERPFNERKTEDFGNILGSITELATSSPFKDLAALRDDLKNDKKTFEF